MTKRIHAEEFCLTDPMGRVRARIYLDINGSPLIEIANKEGRPLRTMSLEGMVSTAPAPPRAGKRETMEEWHHRLEHEVMNTKPKLSVLAYKLYIDFSDNLEQATGKYVNEVIEVQGEVVEVQVRDYGDVFVGLKGISNYYSEVICHFTENQLRQVNNLRMGQKVKIRGKCVEFNNKKVKLWGCAVP